MPLHKNIRELLAIWAMPSIGSVNSRKLISYAGGIENVFKLTEKDLLQIPGFGKSTVKKLCREKALADADKELEFINKYNINVTTFFDDDYPYLLKQSDDCPLLFFTKGKTINPNHKFLSIVGTRNATPRGIEFCNQLISDLKSRHNDICIVSGLAFGIDIAAHKAALENNVSKIAVLGHGLSTIYPAEHKQIAKQMVNDNTILSEFFSSMFADKNNFVRRNRIIAGLSEATIVVESDAKGGSLITADIANSYNREVFAVPGRVTDRFSSGCNHLIKTNQAVLLQSAKDIEYMLGWEQNSSKVQTKPLIINLSEDEEKLMKVFDTNDEMNIDLICRKSGFNMAKVSALLLNLEFMGVVKCLPGKVFAKI